MPITTVADIEAIEQNPISSLPLANSTYDLIKAGLSRKPDTPALHFFMTGDDYTRPVTYTRRQMLQKITQTANMLHSFGIGKEDVVSFLLPNLPQTYFTLFGGEAAGIVSPINPLLEPKIMAELMSVAKTKVLVTIAPFPMVDLWQKIDEVRHLVPTLKTILRIDLGQFLPLHKRLLVNLLKLRLPKDKVVPGQQVLDFDQEVAKHPSDRLVSGREIQPEDIASYFHTGGTTGTPKIAVHTHANEVFNAWVAMQHIGEETTIGKVLFCGLPLFHVNAMMVLGIIPLGYGSVIVLATPQGFRGRNLMTNFWKIVEHFKVSFFAGVPTIFSVLLDIPIKGANVSSLEFALSGAAPMPTEIFHKFEEITGLRLLEGYGLTEGTCVTAVNPTNGERRIGSVGFRMPYSELKTLRIGKDSKYLGECEPGEIGTIALRGPCVFKGYLEEVHNKGLWIDSADGKGLWLNTGDMGRIDADGYLWLTGRSKELIIHNGYSLDPQIIEGELYKHPAVALVAALGRPDANAGEVPIAYIQLKANHAATEAELLEFAKNHITEQAAIPRAIHLVEQLPLTAIGKIHKPPLKHREIEEVYRETIASCAQFKTLAVEMQQDRVQGSVALIKATLAEGQSPGEVEAAIKQALAPFTVPYQLHLE